MERIFVIESLPPGGANASHGHQNEAMFYILHGRGYEIHDGKRYDWEAGDVVYIPINTVHQHFNADNSRPARFISATNRMYRYMGYYGLEQIDDAPAS